MGINDLTPEAKKARETTKNWDVKIVFDQRPVTVTLNAVHRGHVVPIPMGSIVVARFYNNENMNVYDTLDTDKLMFGKLHEHVKNIKPGSVGIIEEHSWHAESHELSHCSISNRTLRDVTFNLWYLVKFHEGSYWVRFDWLEPYVMAE